MRIYVKLLIIVISFALFSCEEGDEEIHNYQAFDTGMGIGKYLYESYSSDRSYNWYIDQGETGVYGNINCGPSVTYMALKWNDRQWSTTVEDFRDTEKEWGVLWNTKQIRDTLNKYTTSCEKIRYDFDAEESPLVAEMRLNRIAVLCVNMNYVSYQENPNFHCGRFYHNVSSHFIIVKGYARTEKGEWFECYDPFSMSDTYDYGKYAGLHKGKNRYYERTDLEEAMENNWKYYIRIK